MEDTTLTELLGDGLRGTMETFYIRRVLILPMFSGVDRRQIITSIGIGVGVLVSGCTEGSEQPVRELHRAKLGSITTRNNSGSERTVDLSVSRDGEPLVDREITLESGDTETIERTWPCSQARFVLEATTPIEIEVIVKNHGSMMVSEDV